MLDGALHSIAERRHRAGARDHRDGARAAPGDDPRAARPLVRARAGRAARPRVRPGAARRSPTRRATRTASSSTLDTRRRAGDSATTAQHRALHDPARAGRPGGPPRPAAAGSRSTSPTTPTAALVASVADDAEPERRRRSLEAIEERVRQLHGAVEIGRRDDGTEVRVDAAGAHRAALAAALATTHRRAVDENGTGQRGYLLFVWSPSGYTLRERDGEPPRGRRRARGRRPDARSSRRSGPRRSPATRAPASTPIGAVAEPARASARAGGGRQFWTLCSVA